MTLPCDKKVWFVTGAGGWASTSPNAALKAGHAVRYRPYP
jgi:hypothetical protein